MRIAIWNVNSIRARLEHCLKFLQDYDIDVLCLQELKCADESFPLTDFQAIGYNCFIYGQKAYNGVAILTKIKPESVEYGFSDGAFDEQKRLIKAVINDIHIYNIYAPNGEAYGTEKFVYKEKWYKRFIKVIKQEAKVEENKVIICGDYNIAPKGVDVYDAKKLEGICVFHPKTTEWFNALLDCGFTDCFRRFNQESETYTWWGYFRNYFEKNKGYRIDHFLTNANIDKEITNCEIIKDPRTWERPTDHAPVVLTLKNDI
ncbi:MAG: exodeoxyribonuclease III [Proteobacteria bacterium]|nr:exodeoxyribonuclease III [Pseudomonadota bacterium]